ncbi:MAG: 2-C-methyl-D-erythritol 4-phosphate cytidylyltransferase [Desulfobacteraceae bacterium]|nr:2-C-methyl-D-erythritol 4-phosphate cytidylyltransferase [Desulfobacteraceae bacterium]
MQNTTRKQYLHIAGKPILWHTLEAIGGCPEIDGIILVCPDEDMPFVRSDIIDTSRHRKKVKMMAGGVLRQQSVSNGLNVLPDDTEIVLIHDGVRPFISSSLLSRCIRNARQYKACIPGLPVMETLKKIDKDQNITSTVDREYMWTAQTPQVFSYEIIKKAHELAAMGQIVETDDAALVEKMGIPVKIISGYRNNIKITTPEDLLLAEQIFASFLAMDNPD